MKTIPTLKYQNLPRLLFTLLRIFIGWHFLYVFDPEGEHENFAYSIGFEDNLGYTETHGITAGRFVFEGLRIWKFCVLYKRIKCRICIAYCT